MPPQSNDRCPGPRLPAGRRDLLRFALTGFATLALPDLLRLRAAAAEPVRSLDNLQAEGPPPASPVPAKSTAVILVWCHGGPSHLETYDPKPEAPAEYRGPFGAIETSVPGLRLSHLLPLQAKVAHRCALLRSVHHRGPCHDSGLQTLLSGHEQLVNRFSQPEHPDCFCIVNRVRPARNGLPVYVGAPPLAYTG